MNGFEIQCIPGGPVPEIYDATSGTAYPEDWFFEAVAGGRTDAGIRVNPSTALSHGPVWQAVNILAGDVGQLPLHVMKMQGKNREKYRNHPVEWIFTGEPNEAQTPSVWKETMMAWALLWGNGCSYIVRDGSGRPAELIPLLPDRTKPITVEYEDEELGELRSFRAIETEVAGRKIPLLYEDVFHIRGLATDGFWGVSAVDICKNAIAHGMALEKHGNKLFTSGARPSGVLTHPKALSVEARKNLREEWYAIHGGIDNSAKIAILMEGSEFKPMSLSSKDAEWMTDRRFDREMIASLFMLPAFKLNALEFSAVRSNLEEQNRDYFNTSLSRHLTKFREEGERKLLTVNERRSGRVYLRWFPEAFLRGDTKSRFETYSLAIAARILNPNEAREKEDMNPYEGGDEFMNPAIEQTRPKDGQPDTSADSSKELAYRLVSKQVQALVETEANALEKAVGAGGPRNFCRWVANYYENLPGIAENFLELPCSIAEANKWKSSVELYAMDGLQAVLVLAEQVTKSGLSAIINEHAKRVRANGNHLTQMILGI